MHILRVSSTSATRRLGDIYSHVNKDPENIVAISVYRRTVAYIIGEAEFIRYQQWRQSTGDAHPGMVPNSIKTGSLNSSDDTKVLLKNKRHASTMKRIENRYKLGKRHGSSGFKPHI